MTFCVSYISAFVPTVIYFHMRNDLGTAEAARNAANVSFQDQRSSLASTLPGAASSHHQNILSHLPLHSQQQAHSLLPVVPVGGLQMLHSPPSPGTDVTPSSAPSPQSSEGQRSSSSRDGSVHGLEMGAEDIRHHRAAQEKSLIPGVRDSRQEENVQTCLKAIASLKITTEDPH